MDPHAGAVHDRDQFRCMRHSRLAHPISHRLRGPRRERTQSIVTVGELDPMGKPTESSRRAEREAAHLGNPGGRSSPEPGPKHHVGTTIENGGYQGGNISSIMLIVGVEGHKASGLPMGKGIPESRDECRALSQVHRVAQYLGTGVPRGGTGAIA